MKEWRTDEETEADAREERWLRVELAVGLVLVMGVVIGVLRKLIT